MPGAWPRRSSKKGFSPPGARRCSCGGSSKSSTHWRPRPGLVHPAAKVFQALRIFVNRELEGLESWLEKIPGQLPAGSRVVFLTYHSLEDRMVKHAFQQLQRQEKVELLRPFPAMPGRDEVEENLASRSAKLRALEVA